MPYGFYACLSILPAAFILDWFLGDPRWKYHPVRIMGKIIEILEPPFRSLVAGHLYAGAFFAVFLISATFCISFLFTKLLWNVSPTAGFVLEIVLIYFCISAKDLEKSALKVYRVLMANDIETARKKLAMIVGRDTDRLSGQGVSRACVETVAENLVDGVIAPLFYASLGGAPLALAYKMVNTLDSMIGYKDEKYLYFGKVSARLDDVLNYIPARLSVPLIALSAGMISGSGRAAYQSAKKEGSFHTSPNAGYPEAAFAGALAVKLGGPSFYKGKRVDKPYIGSTFGKTDPVHIKKSCDLMILSSVWGLVFLWAISFMVRC